MRVAGAGFYWEAKGLSSSKDRRGPTPQCIAPRALPQHLAVWFIGTFSFAYCAPGSGA